MRACQRVLDRVFPEKCVRPTAPLLPKQRASVPS